MQTIKCSRTNKKILYPIQKSPDPAAAFHYIARPHFICKHEFTVEIYCVHPPQTYWG